MVRVRKRLGDILVDEGVISPKQLSEALEKQRGSSKKLGDILVEMKLISGEEILKVLGEQMGIPYISMSRAAVEKEAILSLKREVAERFNVVPISKNGGVLHVAMDDPLDIFAIDAIEEASGFEVSQAIANGDEVRNAIEKYYSPVFLKGEDDSREGSKEEHGDISAVDVVDKVLKKAVMEGASDVHIEAEATIVRIRFRIDGILHQMMTYSKGMHSAIISRIKVMAKLDITEKRIPQDGRVETELSGRSIDMRISTLPTVFGEKVVIRLLDKDNVRVSLESLGFQGENLANLENLISRPNGIFFVTGPTGSGKTSTLYAAINEINSLEKNIITLEDPVEYQLEIINQVQINPGAGLTFASGLRSVLRQDPDVIMIGEIRDLETAEIAIESAMTGHLVFSTLHTNSAVGTISRLIDMGVQPFLLSATLAGVLGQRLIRRLCPHCKRERQVTEAEAQALGVDLGSTIYEANGCSLCRDTGYQGRTALIELLMVDKDMRSLISRGSSTETLKGEAESKGMKTMKQQGYEKVLEGVTTMEEVLRVAQDDI
ncbi:hypothetical protein PM10SUCC1_25330 [Propionigenium maris DSM 9537]|uniref:Bacterial type II secretion system protein E domain-containing protein n=1 Tax=Propionigenium maris DSM 9537 TaxID=1123000 RepID=A0A9W6LNL6_9FUSO|nr:ATPase, T2SS/T4P/T4SS family [Propionigenium maris]GLI57019.1 hypothetical protein PM10SUCC1_25330 [Propionigenium maris DSM 9537]